jgi:O-antigen/teichoic acid export membrane protein
MTGVWYAIPAFEKINSLGLWLFAVPPLALCVSTQSVAMYLASRQQRYRTIVYGNLVQQAVAAVLGIGFGIGAMKVGGLYFARLASAMSASVVLGAATLLWSLVRFEFDRENFRRLAVRYRQFPIFNVLYSLLGVLSRDFPVLALTAFGLAASAGHFALARIAATFPVNFLTTSITQVFYREATEHIDTPSFKDMIWNLMRALMFGLVPLFVLAALWSSPLFARLLGENWRESGEMFALLVAPMSLALLTGWPERIFEIREKQYWSLAVQLVFDAMVMVSVTMLLAYEYSIIIVLAVFAVLLSAYQLTYLALVFVLTGLGMRKYLTLVAMLAGLVAVMILGHFGAAMVLNHVATFFVGLALAGAFSLIGLRFGLRVI